MSLPESDSWSERIRQTLARYDTALLREVAGRLVKPRGEWPVEELIDRCSAALSNGAVIDKRLRELDVPCRRLLALVGKSRQPRWQLGGLLELLAALGHAEGLRPVFTLLGAGLLYPVLDTAEGRVAFFEQWLHQAAVTGYAVFAPPTVTA